MGNENPDNDFSARARVVGFAADSLGRIGLIGLGNNLLLFMERIKMNSR